jgi:transcriptional regulator with XRE-family HTH domain
MSDETLPSLTPFSDFLKAQRAELGESQMVYAARLNVKPASIGQWERSEGYPRMSALPNLAEKLGIPVRQLHELIRDQKNAKNGNIGNPTSSMPAFSNRHQDEINSQINVASEIIEETRTIMAPIRPDSDSLIENNIKDYFDARRRATFEYTQMAVRRAMELGALGQAEAEVDLRGSDLPPYKYDYVSQHLVALFFFVPEPKSLRSSFAMTARRFTWKLALSQADKIYEHFCSACLFIIVRGGEEAHPEAAAEIRRLRAEARLLNVRIRILDSTEDVAQEIIKIEKIHIRDAQKWLDEREFYDHRELNSELNNGIDEP